MKALAGLRIAWCSIGVVSTVPEPQRTVLFASVAPEVKYISSG